MTKEEVLRKKLTTVLAAMKSALQHVELCEKAAKAANEELEATIAAYSALESQRSALQTQLY